jgi:heme exporter protein CcmD
MGHGAFIFAAYAITALVMLGIIGAIVRDYVVLRRELAKFPPRGNEAEDA